MLHYLQKLNGPYSPTAPKPAQENREALSFRSFVDRVRPGYQWYRHCVVLADNLQRVADGDLKRLMVFEPPRHGKSELVSRLFPAYCLYRYPDEWVGLCSYAAELAFTLSRKAREFYREAGGDLNPAAKASDHWETGGIGGMWSAGIGGPITGKGAHKAIIDDAFKNAQDAQSLTIREGHKDWYRSTLYTRLEPDAAVVIVQTRWNEDDLSGWLLGSEAENPEYWHVLNFEAIKDEPQEFPPTCTVEPDWREDGQALCPERYPVDVLRQIESTMGEYFFGALYQQRPRPREGGMFRRAGFEIVPAGPAQGIRVRYWDKAGAEPGKGDWTVGCLMCRTMDGLFWIEDVVRGQWGADERNKIIKQTAELDRQRYGTVTIWIEQPPGLAKESTQAVVRLLAGFPVYADPVKKDKVERAEPLAAQVQAGNVRLVRGPWNAAFIEELCSFPNAKHDDQVDGGSGAFNKLAIMGPGRILAGPQSDLNQRLQQGYRPNV